MKILLTYNRLSEGIQRMGFLFWLVLLLLWGVSPAYALEVEDSVQTADMPLTAFDNNGNAAALSISPEQLKLQKRYRPAKESIAYIQPKWRRLFVNAGGGINWINDNITIQHQGTINAGVGYHFTPVHSLLANFEIINYRRSDSDDSAQGVGGSLDYMVNLLNFAGGYKPDRLGDVDYHLGVGGLSASLGEGEGRMFSPFVRTGLLMNLNMTRNVSLYVDPYVGLQKSMEHILGNENPEKWDLMYGIQAGLMVNFEDQSKSFSFSDSIKRQVFTDFSAGWTTPIFSGGFFSQSGAAYQLAFGKWLNPVIGFRAGIQTQSFFYKQEDVTVLERNLSERYEQLLYSGRGELMIDVFNISSQYKNNSRLQKFGFNFLIGAELGQSRQYGDDKADIKRYHGFTEAAQFLYRINNPGIYLYLEPRFLTVYSNQGEGLKNNHANMFTVSVGTRTYINRNYKHTKAVNFEDSHWWISTSIGGEKWNRSSIYSHGSRFGGINPSVSFGVGHDISRLASLRVQANYQHLYRTVSESWNGYEENVWDLDYDLLDLRVSYMMNLSNLLQGYLPHRRFSTWWTIGPNLSYLLRNHGNKYDDQTQEDYSHLSHSSRRYLSPGISTSLLAVLQVNNRIDLTGEALGQVNFRKGIFPGTSLYKTAIKYGFEMGTRFHFALGQLRQGGIGYRNSFFDVSAGYSTPTFKQGFTHHGGSNNQFSFGHWFMPIFGLRLGGSTLSYIYDIPKENLHGVDVLGNCESTMFAWRLETLFNPLNFADGWREKPTGHNFGLNLSAGAEYGLDSHNYISQNRLLHDYFGLTAAFQLLYRVNHSNTSLYFEPRIINTHYVADGQYYHDNLYSLSIGTRLNLHDYDTRHVSSTNDTIVRHWWLGADFGGTKWMRSYYYRIAGEKNIGYNLATDISLGYDISRLSSLRAQLGLQQLHLISDDQGLWKSKYDVIDLRFSYLFNISNLLQGYHRDRKFNLWWTAGPALTYIFKEKDFWVNSQDVNSSQDQRKSQQFDHKLSPAMASSFLITYKVAPQIDITAETMGQYNLKRGIYPSEQSNALNNLKYIVSIGTRYHMTSGQFRHTTGEGRRMFLDVSTGWITPSLKSVFSHMSGNSYNVSIGKWIHPLLGFRVGIGGQSFVYSKENMTFSPGCNYIESKEEILHSGRAEVVFAPLNFFVGWRNKENGHNFDLNLSLGSEIGFNRIGKEKEPSEYMKYKGVTTSTQLLYRVNGGGTYLYLEPRYMRTHYKNSSDDNETHFGNNYSVNFGARTYLASASIRKDNELFQQGLWTSFNFGTEKWHRLTYIGNGGQSLNPFVSVSCGYDFTKYLSVCTTIKYQNLHNATFSSYQGTDQDENIISGMGCWNTSYHIMDLHFNYMLNIINLLRGYKADRNLNLWWSVGPAFSYIINDVSKWDSDQTPLDPTLHNIHVSASRKKEKSPAIYTAISPHLRVTDHWDIICDVWGQYNAHKNINPDYYSVINNLKYGIGLGTCYHF